MSIVSLFFKFDISTFIKNKVTSPVSKKPILPIPPKFDNPVFKNYTTEIGSEGWI